MLVIGLTGPTGAGKGRVAETFASFGLPVIDADAVYHALLVPPSPCLEALCARFGETILSDDGRLNRRALGTIVFSDPDALADLNTIAHRYVMDAIRAKLADLRQKNTPAALLDAPQLFEAGAERDCNIVVSVLADAPIRMERIMQRDGIDREAAQMRMAAQKSDEFFRLHSDYVIENNNSPEILSEAVKRILTETGVLS